ncbi:hypothetical protein AWC38_SpisGene1130 [Stylophora pistillata]|uniref:HECT domain-containing protein n=1 Tax=Stylophora pistillata TaxID=50429 RepID=A0A2B4SZK8_STYPI|nr:hypothetical protein AWC38_SpisGene1130 [Stylophora pistillata]
MGTKFKPLQRTGFSESESERFSGMVERWGGSIQLFTELKQQDTKVNSTYQLLYHDKSEVKTLPGSDERFVLQRSREEIDKSYARLTFYLCSSDDYLDNLLFEDDDDKSLEEPVFVTEIEDIPSHDNDDSDNEGNPSLVTEAQLTSSESREVESGNERSIVCPRCHSLFPLSVIEGHADQCSMWLLDDEEQPCVSQSYGGTSNGVEKTTTGQELTGQQHKAALKDKISELSGQLLSQDTKRLTVRRKFIWLDFKSAMETKIDPKSSLKVVFTGEPAVDGGGPKRELFSELLIIVKERFFFEGGKLVTSAVALNAGDFKTCGKSNGAGDIARWSSTQFHVPRCSILSGW